MNKPKETITIPKKNFGINFHVRTVNIYYCYFKLVISTTVSNIIFSLKMYS